MTCRFRFSEMLFSLNITITISRSLLISSVFSFGPLSERSLSAVAGVGESQHHFSDFLGLLCHLNNAPLASQRACQSSCKAHTKHALPGEWSFITSAMSAIRRMSSPLWQSQTKALRNIRLARAADSWCAHCRPKIWNHVRPAATNEKDVRDAKTSFVHKCRQKSKSNGKMRANAEMQLNSTAQYKSLIFAQ